MSADEYEQRELQLNRFRRLIGEILRGEINRNTFAPWEIDLCWISRPANCLRAAAWTFFASIRRPWNASWKPAPDRPCCFPTSSSCASSAAARLT